MPRISIFLGIVIYMYYDDHNPPHFHALYEGVEAIFNMGGNLLKGDMVPRVQRLIKEWCLIHKTELMDNYQRAKEDKPLNWIEPLR
jgi:Domain of unknown function (DUF4160)